MNLQQLNFSPKDLSLSQPVAIDRAMARQMGVRGSRQRGIVLTDRCWQKLLEMKVLQNRYGEWHTYDLLGDGTGSTFVGLANNCVQDSNRALFASIRTTARRLQENPQILQLLLEEADQAQRFRTLQALGKDLERLLEPFGSLSADWEKNEYKGQFMNCPYFASKSLGKFSISIVRPMVWKR